MNAQKGTLLLTLAQVWHAVSNYVVFITGARLLGIESYGDFALVVWTMTMIEVFVVDGVPRAVSFWVARVPEATATIARRGFLVTTMMAVLLAGALAAGAPLLGALWDDQDLVFAVRISALDFLAFVAFAVLTQAVNGLQRYGIQAAVWLCYSTAKVTIVLAFLEMGWGVTGGVLGYVLASLVGSLIAFVATSTIVAPYRSKDAPSGRMLLDFGVPLATQSLALMALVNVDLWAAKRHGEGKAVAGAYIGAATLARALFFIFRAFGDALFPAVARAVARRDLEEARLIAHKGLGQLCCFLIPLLGLAMGAARPSLEAVYGATSFGDGARFLVYLAPAAALWTFTAVFVALVAAASRPWRAAVFLMILTAFETGLVFALASEQGALGAARGSLAASALGCLVAGALAVRILGAIVPLAPLLSSVLGALILDRAVRLWVPEGWWVFVYGAGLYVLVLAAFVGGSLLPRPGGRRR